MPQILPSSEPLNNKEEEEHESRPTKSSPSSRFGEGCVFVQAPTLMKGNLMTKGSLQHFATTVQKSAAKAAIIEPQSEVSNASQQYWDAGAVARFAAGDADILVLPRRPMDHLGPAVQAGRVHEYLAPVRRENIGFEVRAGLGELRMKSPELTADLVSLVTSFLDQFGLRQARLRVEITRSQSCPKFHCDNIQVRLVTTYLGPTTEYQYAGEDMIHVAPLYGLVFLKGHKHPIYRDSVHHRSPEVPVGDRRLCVAIDY
jgi:hypothetical protein